MFACDRHTPKYLLGKNLLPEKYLGSKYLSRSRFLRNIPRVIFGREIFPENIPRKGRFKPGDFFSNIAPKCSEPRGGPYLTAWHENSKKEHPLLGCASRHPSLREVEGLRGPASFATVVIVTLTIGDAGVTG